MANEKSAAETPAKKSFPLVPLAVGGVLTVILSVGSVMGTLVATGYFDRPAVAATGEGGDLAAAESGERPAPDQKASPDAVRPETQYFELSRPLTANVANSRKVMQVTVALMTHYDKTEVEKMTKHELAIRSAMLDVLSTVSEQTLMEPDFKDGLADQLRVASNAVLEEYESFGGIEKVLFSEFLVQ